MQFIIKVSDDLAAREIRLIASPISVVAFPDKVTFGM